MKKPCFQVCLKDHSFSGKRGNGRVCLFLDILQSCFFCMPMRVKEATAQLTQICGFPASSQFLCTAALRNSIVLTTMFPLENRKTLNKSHEQTPHTSRTPNHRVWGGHGVSGSVIKGSDLCHEIQDSQGETKRQMEWFPCHRKLLLLTSGALRNLI